MSTSLNVEKKESFYLVCMGVTVEVEMRECRTWLEMCSGWRVQRYLHLGVNWKPKSELCQFWCVGRVPELCLTYDAVSGSILRPKETGSVRHWISYILHKTPAYPVSNDPEWTFDVFLDFG